MKLNPVTLMKNPVMFVVEVGAALVLLFLIRDIVTGAGGHRLRAADRPVALVHRAVRQFRRSDGRGARQGAGRIAAQDQDRHDREPRSSTAGEIEQVPASKLRAGDVVVVAARARSFPATARSSKASPPSTSR